MKRKKNESVHAMLETALKLVAATAPAARDDGSQRLCAAMPGPAVAMEHFESTPWASATFEGLRHEFSLSVSGAEDQVDALAARLERDMLTGEFALDDVVLADVERVETEKTLDGAGGARTLLYFEALTVRD